MVLADGSSLAGPTAAFDPPQPMLLYGWSANYCRLERKLLPISRCPDTCLARACRRQTLAR